MHSDYTELADALAELEYAIRQAAERRSACDINAVWTAFKTQSPVAQTLSEVEEIGGVQ